MLALYAGKRFYRQAKGGHPELSKFALRVFPGRALRRQLLLQHLRLLRRTARLLCMPLHLRNTHTLSTIHSQLSTALHSAPICQAEQGKSLHAGCHNWLECGSRRGRGSGEW